MADGKLFWETGCNFSAASDCDYISDDFSVSNDHYVYAVGEKSSVTFYIGDDLDDLSTTKVSLPQNEKIHGFSFICQRDPFIRAERACPLKLFASRNKYVPSDFALENVSANWVCLHSSNLRIAVGCHLSLSTNTTYWMTQTPRLNSLKSNVAIRGATVSFCAKAESQEGDSQIVALNAAYRWDGKEASQMLRFYPNIII